MLKINYNQKTYEVRNNVEELLLKEFEDVSAIFNYKEKDQFEKWSEIFVYIGLDQEIVDELDTFAFIDIIKEFNIVNLESTDIIKDFEIDGDLYVAYEDKFKLTVKEMTLVEHYIKKNENRYLGEIMAIIYKRPGFDKTINFDKAHIHHKAELFRKSLTADKAVPFISFLSKKLITDYELIEQDTE